MLGLDLSVGTTPDDLTRGRGTFSSTNRSQLILLQVLITVVLCYELLFSKSALISFEVQEVLVLGLMLLIGGLMVLPVGLWEAHWLIGAVVISDTVLTTSIIYLSGNAASDLYLTYFLIILIAAFSPRNAKATNPGRQECFHMSISSLALVTTADRRDEFFVI